MGSHALILPQFNAPIAVKSPPSGPSSAEFGNDVAVGAAAARDEDLRVRQEQDAMTLFGMKWVWGTGLAAAGLFAAVAVPAPAARAADEIIGPAYGGETYAEPPPVVVYREAERYAVPVRRPPPVEAAVLPPREVFGALRARGFEPLGPALRRGWIYSIAVLDPNGDDGRLMVDARTGRVMRFVPAYAVSPRFNDELAVRYGRFGQPRIDDPRHAPRPPMTVPRGAEPRMVSRSPSTVPLPRPRHVTRVAAKPAAARAADKPATDRATPETTASVESKTVGVAQTTAKPADARPVVAAKPVEVELKPTQDMPPVQPLD